MIPFVLFLGVVPGAVGYALYPRLTSRKVAWLAALGAGALMTGYLAATARFWWLPPGTEAAPLASILGVTIALGAIAGFLLVTTFVGLFGGPDPATPRPLHRIIATAVTGMASMLLCPRLIEIQGGLS